MNTSSPSASTLLARFDAQVNNHFPTQNEKDEDDRGSKATRRMKTVVRMVSGYLNNPNGGFPKPTRADIEEYYNNFGLYKVKKER